ncbi:MAG: hypothetical protein ACI9S8_003175, partial [Chlamydiales bacterium]
EAKSDPDTNKFTSMKLLLFVQIKQNYTRWLTKKESMTVYSMKEIQ